MKFTVFLCWMSFRPSTNCCLNVPNLDAHLYNAGFQIRYALELFPSMQRINNREPEVHVPLSNPREWSPGNVQTNIKYECIYKLNFDILIPTQLYGYFSIVLPVHFKLIVLAILCTTLSPWHDSSYLFLYFQALEKGVGSRSSGVLLVETYSLPNSIQAVFRFSMFMILILPRQRL